MPQSPKRPGTVVFAAVLLFIFGGLGLLGGVCGGGVTVVMAVVQDKPVAAPGMADPKDALEPMRFIAKEVPFYTPWMIGSLILAVIFGIADIVFGVGVLKLSNAARMGAILLIVLKMLINCGGHIFNFAVVFPVQMRFYEQNPQIPGGAAIAQASAYITTGLAVVFQLALALTIIALLYSPSARAAFSGKYAVGPDDERLPPREDGYDDDYNPPGSGGSPETGIKDRG